MNMYVKNFLKTLYFNLCLKELFSLALNLTGDGYCNDNTGGMRCCANYRNISGRCEPCLGSYGLHCNRICPDGYYGQGCKRKCNCLPTESCHKIHGCSACIGSFGENCSEPCPFGFFGIDCLEKCNCSSDTHWCDNISGCKNKDTACRGSFGEKCNELSSLGFFDFNCSKNCTCSNDTHWCDNISGCKIKDGGMHVTHVEGKIILVRFNINKNIQRE
ncbi:multiple epidermal growth factor-like domains protein 11 [Ostrea edulis]|uniref:multiple epidermal growth factor-like domains protein 11 n=1 Tax=Ostrea edulis TaxID=37623 RepID=UPI0024AF66ED|nr:multiple epidermal growth factor-like domains protein 11 [Ostrea edulis]